MSNEELILAAREAQTFSHSPYSKFRVGAALLTKSGKLFTGCNVENASYGLSNCAERTALFKAVSEGEKEFDAIAIVSDAENYIPPCGACRQVMLEFFTNNTKIIISDLKNNYKVFTIEQLIPFSFTDKYLDKKI